MVRLSSSSPPANDSALEPGREMVETLSADPNTLVLSIESFRWGGGGGGGGGEKNKNTGLKAS